MKTKSPQNISPKVLNAFETPVDWSEGLSPKEFYASPKISILYQDESLIVVNKPAGLLVHPMSENDSEKKNLLKLVKWQAEKYLYPIHRLDRPVSGIVIFALNKKAAKSIKENWHHDQFIKEYTALVVGKTPEAGSITIQLEDEKGIPRDSITHFQRVAIYNDKFSLIKVQIHTGRNHQIRRHLKMIDHPIVGDILHGNSEINKIFNDHIGFTRIFLQASKMEFFHPEDKRKLVVESKLDSELEDVLVFINSHSSLF